MSDYKILCLDDDLDVLEIQSQIVQESGYETITFSEPEKAIEYLKDNKDQVLMILSDLKMDKISGFDFKKLINPFADEVPFVVITGYWTKEMSAQAMDLGINAFLEKPLSVDLLREYIEKYVEVRKETLEDQKEMVAGFIEESSAMLDEIESLILELEEDPESDQTLSIYFRLLHTIKGTASCVGLNELAGYTHKYEDFINELRNRVISVNTETTNALLGGLDDLKVYYAQINKKFTDVGAVDPARQEMFNVESYANGNAPVIASSDNADESTPEKKETSAASATSSKKEDDKMTVPMSILNDFMEESGELTVIRNTILKTVKSIEARYRGDHDVELLNELLVGIHNVTSNIQGKIVEMRKVPLKNTFRPFKRLVRDISKQLNKEVELEITGEELSVDNIVAKLFSNTMIHILRNSLDHGLEVPAEREANGKDPVGNLKIKVEEVGEDIVLEVVDDGKGINPDFIKAKALEKGLYSEDELNRMSKLEIINIIFASGFSTAEQVSDLSGRGVGMDMVRGSFEEMGGEIIVFSEVGVGSTFRLKVPIPKSVLIINTLSVRVNDEFYIFHMDEVSEVIRYAHDNDSTKLYNIDGQNIISHNGESIQLVYLSDIINKPRSEESEVKSIVVLRVGDSKYGVMVDEIYEFEEVVSRKIHDSINETGIYHGAALLGTGQVAMILSAQGLAGYVSLEINEKKKSFEEEEDIYGESAFDEYMLFKFDGDNYLAVDLDSVNRFETLNTATFEMVGENVIVRYRNKVLPLMDPAFKLGLSEKDGLLGVMQEEQNVEIIVGQYEGRLIGLYVESLDEIKRSYDELNQDTIDMPGLKGSIFVDDKTICVLSIPHLVELLAKRKPIVERKDNVLEFNIPEDDNIAA
tara:strand:- start:109170 stop:111785 length:2616 start_codon:yes stop_codon:yes gene_type:complete